MLAKVKVMLRKTTIKTIIIKETTKVMMTFVTRVKKWVNKLK